MDSAFWIDISFAVLLRTVKNEESKKNFRAAFLKVFRSIRAAFPGDPDFE